MTTLLIPFLLLISGFAVLIFAAEILLKGTISTSVRLNISPAIVSLTVIAFGTSAPELVTSLIAAIQGSSDVAVGNVIGSNIFNLMGIIGLVSLIKPSTVSRDNLKKDWPWLISATLAFALFAIDFSFERTDGLMMIAMFLIFMFVVGRKALRESKEFDPASEEITKTKSPWLDLVYIVGGIAGLTIGAKIALDGAVDIGRYAGLTERVIGLTIVSIGTGLPELAASAIAVIRGRDDVSIANILGSNLMNTLFITGTVASILPLSIESNIVNYDLYWLLGATIGMWLLIFAMKGNVPKWLGGLFLAAYFTYIVTLI